MKKAKSVLFIMLLCVVSLSMASCARTENTDTSKTETRTVNVGRISEIEAGFVNVVITPGLGSGTAQISGPAYLLDKVTMTTGHGKLEISINNVELKNSSDAVQLTITADVHDVKAYGMSNIKFTAPVATSRNFDIEAYASGSVEIPTLSAAKVNMEVYSAGTVRIGTLNAKSEFDAESYNGAEIAIGEATAPETDLEAYNGGIITIDSGSLGACSFEAGNGGSIDAKAVVSSLEKNVVNGGNITVG